MAITFPTTLDTLTNPAVSDPQNNPTHAGQHSDENDALEALEAKVGVDSSAVATSLDYLVKNPASTSPGHVHSVHPLLLGRSGGQTLIGGSAVTDILKLQGTSGNGTATSPAVQVLVGNAGATVAMTVLNNGNVGIGTTSPRARLDVTQPIDTAASSGRFERYTSSSAASFYGATKLVAKSSANVPDGFGVGMSFGLQDDTQTTDTLMGLFGVVRDGADNSGAFRFDTYNAGVAGTSMFIKANGNVGIGTTAPTNILSFGGNSARIVWLERHSTANTAGNNLLVQAGGATVAATDKNGGIVTLAPGLSTGVGFASARFQRLTRASSTATADNALKDALIVTSEANLTNNTAVGLFEVALAAGALAGGTIQYTITVSDGTDFQTYSGYVSYAAVNKGDVYTTAITDLATVDSAVSSSVATLVTTWSIVSGASKVTIKVNANSSLTPTVMKIYYVIHNGSVQTVTQL